MRIISANLNQRLGNIAVRSRFELWLRSKQPDLLLAQEPFKPGQQDRPAIPGYQLVSTSPLISCWISTELAPPSVTKHTERWHEINYDGLSAHNVYLSPYSSAERRAMLDDLASAIRASDRRAVLVAGDFNLAPRSEDGLFGDEPSAFTKPPERRAFENLLSSANLADATCPSAGESPAFTLERVQQGRASRFRCDLALLSRDVAESACVEYDHSVRKAPGAFTDHSALVIDVHTGRDDRILAKEVVPRAKSAPPEVHVRVAPTEVTASDSHKTAISRQSPSQIARKLNEQGVLADLYVQSILDYGCGYGADVRFYRSIGFEADGFDIEPRFGWTDSKDRLYDLVTLVFVVNVLPMTEDRLVAVRDAARHVKPGGYLLIAARSESAIAAEARKGRWAPFNDGWISAPQKGTFQKGITSEEIAWFAGAIGFRIVDSSLRLSSDVSWLLCQRPG